jgi:hypothetical protein
MTIQAYTAAELNILPAPVTTGGTQGFIDLYGEQWIAKPGVYGGNWVKARDGLRAWVYRAAAFSPPTAATGLFPADSVKGDPYGMWTGNPSYQFTVPVAGWYRLYNHWVGTGAVSPNYVGMSFYQNGTQVINENMIVCASGNITPRLQALISANANDYFQAYYFASVAVTDAVGLSTTGFSVAYMGRNS